MGRRLSIRQDIVGFDVDWSKSVLGRYCSYLKKIFFNVLSSLFLCEVIVVISYMLLGIVALARRHSFPLR